MNQNDEMKSSIGLCCLSTFTFIGILIYIIINGEKFKDELVSLNGNVIDVTNNTYKCCNVDISTCLCENNVNNSIPKCNDHMEDEICQYGKRCCNKKFTGGYCYNKIENNICMNLCGLCYNETVLIEYEFKNNIYKNIFIIKCNKEQIKENLCTKYNMGQKIKLWLMKSDPNKLYLKEPHVGISVVIYIILYTSIIGILVSCIYSAKKRKYTKVDMDELP